MELPALKIEDGMSNCDIIADIEISCQARPHIDIQYDPQQPPLDANLEDKPTIEFPSEVSQDKGSCLDGCSDVLSDDDVWDFADCVSANPSLVHVIQPQTCVNASLNDPLDEVTENDPLPPTEAYLLDTTQINNSPDSIEEKCLVRVLPKDQSVSSDDVVLIDDSDDEAKVVIDDKNITELIDHRSSSDFLTSDNLDQIANGSSKDNMNTSFTSTLRPTCNLNRANMTTTNILADTNTVSTNAEPYQCKVCEKNFLKDEDLKVHIGLEHQETLQICRWCKKAFTTKEYLALHIELKHKTKKTVLVCYICDESYYNHDEFAKHMEKHCVKVVAPTSPDEGLFAEDQESDEMENCSVVNDYVCSICKKPCKNKFGLKLHYICKHSNYHPYKCEVCHEGFMNTTRLKTHYIVKHNYGKMAVGNTKIHIKQEIKQEKDVIIFQSGSNSHYNVCTQCKETFDHRILYLFHMEVIHGVKIKTNEETFRDGKIIDRPAQRKCVKESFRPDNHMRLKFKWCVICGCKFPSNAQLLKHKHTAHQGQSSFPCERCSKRFSSVALLEQHVRLHCSGQSLSCSFCDKSFRTMVTLQVHMRLHIGWEFKCSLCGRAFTSSSSLRLHYISIHSDYMPFRCSFCSNIFSTKIGCQTHIRKKHVDASCSAKNMDGLSDIVSSLIEAVESDKLFACKCGESFDHPILLAYHGEIKHNIKITNEHKIFRRIQTTDENNATTRVKNMEFAPETQKGPKQVKNTNREYALTRPGRNKPVALHGEIPELFCSLPVTNVDPSTESVASEKEISTSPSNFCARDVTCAPLVTTLKKTPLSFGKTQKSPLVIQIKRPGPSAENPSVVKTAKLVPFHCDIKTSLGSSAGPSILKIPYLANTAMSNECQIDLTKE